MPVPVIEQVTRAVLALVQSLGQAEGLTVYRNRRQHVGVGDMPALNLLRVGHRDSQGVSEEIGHTAYILELGVVGYARLDWKDRDSADQDRCDALLDTALTDLYAKVVSAVLADPTLGGLVVDIAEGGLLLDADRGEGKESAGMFDLTLSVTYWTKPGDPYTVGP